MNPSFSSPTTNLLDEALGIGCTGSVPWRIALVQDCVEASGAFLLHHLLKRSLSAEAAGAVVFLGLAQPFSHYDRVLRKMGCNLSLQRNKNKLHFIDLLDLEFLVAGGTDQNAIEDGFMNLYNRILRFIEANNLMHNNGGWIRIIIDDISLLEIAAQGSSSHTFDFLQYCATLTSELDCSLLILNHGDIYSSEEDQCLLSHLDYLSDVVIKAETLSTGIAVDVHGQLTIINKRALGELGWSSSKVYNFQFKLKENAVEFFYPGTKF
ncbi:elongator complex protein 6-like isoform X1 [Zingiber officinale]|uniref:elongator complex protein 6-like isoform X1 n=1 Tax=Zingiber officinale TaxID=94328 RepID=UPI001C4BC706|nr:elongator complex protein 6-like isoform X1 [Zingiber officinale]